MKFKLKFKLLPARWFCKNRSSHSGAIWFPTSYKKFNCRNDGLYCLDVDNGSGHTNLLTMVNNQKQLFSDFDVQRHTGQIYSRMFMTPFRQSFFSWFENRGVKECEVDCRHINIASKIYGLSKHALEGKSVQKPNKMPPRDSTTTNLPPSILQKTGR